MTDDALEILNRIRPVRPAAPRPAQIAPSQYIDHDFREAASEAHTRALQLRTEARRDAAIVVARARERGGLAPAAWSALDADTIFLFLNF